MICPCFAAIEFEFEFDCIELGPEFIYCG
jgi:hypothetical protein